MLDIGMLDDDQKNRLLEALIEERGAGSPDQAELMDAVQFLAQRLELLEKVVMDDLIGGIEGLYNDNKRKMSIADLKGKFGGDLDGYSDKYKSLFEGVTGGDLYGDLLDQLDDDEKGWQGEEPFNRDSRIPELVKLIKEKFGDVVEMPGVEKVEAEVEMGSKEEDPSEELKNRIKKMSAKQKLF